MTDRKMKQLASTFAHSEEIIFWHLWEYVVRNTSVRWLCSMSDEIEVEIYGAQVHWDDEKEVRPFCKGMLPHGSPIAAVYNKALYSLVVHQADLESQRLVEATACGAIPIVYDCRHQFDGEPQGSESCLWFRTKEELRACLTQRPLLPPHHVGQGRTFADFTKRILTDIQSHLSG